MQELVNRKQKKDNSSINRMAAKAGSFPLTTSTYHLLDDLVDADIQR